MDNTSNGPARLTRAWSSARDRLSGAVAQRSIAARRSAEAAVRTQTAIDATREVIAPARAWRGGAVGTSFLALVALPALLFFIYAAAWQSNRYVAEARLTVRPAQEQRSAPGDSGAIIGKLSNSAPKSTIQDSFIVLNYIKSQAILFDLGDSAYLEKYFSLDDVDYFSRLTRDARIEDKLKYWLGRIAASVDTTSGILTLKVDAFRPQDAARIAQDVVSLSERLVNNVTLRSRTDAVARAEREVALAADKLAAARDKLTAFRNQGALIDPASRAQSIGETIGKLTLDKIGIENSLWTLQKSLDADSPTQRIQRSRLMAIEQQIDALKKTLTDPQSDQTVSAQIASYERLKLDEQFNERMYTIAESAYQRARQELDKQQLYLMVVVQPTLPERATHPRVWANTLLLFAALFIVWSICALIIASISDQKV